MSLISQREEVVSIRKLKLRLGSVSSDCESNRHTMAQLSWIQGFLFIILHLTVAADETSVIKREGDEVMLSCPKLIDGQRKCRNTTWIFAHSKTSSSVELVTLGQINSYNADRLSLTSDCSLVIKKVREEDAGQYECQQWDTERDKDTLVHRSTVYLSVVHLTEQTENQRATLSCSVVTSDPCRYKVQWFYQDMNNKESSSGPGCSATVTLSSGFRFAQCKVTQTGTDEEFRFSLQPSAGKIQPTTKPGNTKSETTKQKTRNDSKTSKAGTFKPTTKPGNTKSETTKQKTHNDSKTSKESSFLTLAHSDGADLTAKNDPEGDVAYASISYTKKSSSNTKVRGKNDEDDDDDDGSVTYSKVNLSKPSSSDDPSKLYAVVNKPKH
ncbi:uncharacterized protein LOC129356484 [Poeciliopsis prolifica]|uniref:uncharacterized protein LOC129356484 n=1 Tax=Poeciliopsis prolifica TaxID=188132 RepID=UPI0024141C04|nr:uncharacterized protein LOC129356484 [Poeciliopsis prolifica]